MNPGVEMRFQIHPDVAWQQAADEVFVVTADNRLHNLRDAVSVHLWNALQTDLSMESLVASLLDEFDVSEAEAREDLLTFIQEIEELQLIQRVS